MYALEMRAGVIDAWSVVQHRGLCSVESKDGAVCGSVCSLVRHRLRGVAMVPPRRGPPHAVAMCPGPGDIYWH